MKKYKIAVIIVTYNRKNCLANCIKALFNQTQLPDYVYIIDNHSSDDSKECIANEGLLSHNEVIVRYIYLDNNTGGAGGFYTGMKMAFDETNCDAFLLMDDDGIPDSMEIENLCKHLNEYDYINAFVINKDNHNQMSFKSDIKNRSRYEFEKRANQEGIVLNHANPFNGSLYSRRLVEKVGFPNPNLFIYGDEVNYQLRIMEQGFIPVTVIDAVHYHPISKSNTVEVNLIGYKIHIGISNRPLTIYCVWRNSFYNLRTCKMTLREKFRILLYGVLVLNKYRKISQEAYRICLQAISDGFKKDLSKHYEYVGRPNLYIRIS